MEPHGKFELSSLTVPPHTCKTELKLALLPETVCKILPLFLCSLIENEPVKVSLCSDEGTFQAISVTFVIMKKIFQMRKMMYCLLPKTAGRKT